MKLAKLKPDHVQTMMRETVGAKVTYTFHKSDKKESKRTVVLAARAANVARSVLSNALDDAVMLGRIPANPAKPLRAYMHEEAELTVWSAAEIVAFTETTLRRGCEYHALFYLAPTAGLRAGQLMAFEWADLKRDRLRISRTASVKGSVGRTKSRAGRRILTLPADTLEVLQRHKRGLREGGLDSPLLFPTSSGSMVKHSNLRRCLHAWADKASVPRIRVHDLRHTYASVAISAGVNAAELARQLGQADPGFTMRKYVHFFELATLRSAPTLA